MWNGTYACKAIYLYNTIYLTIGSLQIGYQFLYVFENWTNKEKNLAIKIN